MELKASDFYLVRLPEIQNEHSWKRYFKEIKKIEGFNLTKEQEGLIELDLLTKRFCVQFFPRR